MQRNFKLYKYDLFTAEQEAESKALQENVDIKTDKGMCRFAWLFFRNTTPLNDLLQLDGISFMLYPPPPPCFDAPTPLQYRLVCSSGRNFEEIL